MNDWWEKMFSMAPDVWDGMNPIMGAVADDLKLSAATGMAVVAVLAERGGRMCTRLVLCAVVCICTEEVLQLTPWSSNMSTDAQTAKHHNAPQLPLEPCDGTEDHLGSKWPFPRVLYIHSAT